MIKIQFNTMIKQPLEKVFAFLSNPENETRWQPDLRESKLTSAGPIGVGATGRDVRTFMGREAVTTWQVSEYEPNRKMAFQVISGPMPFQGSFLFEAMEEGISVVYIVQAETSGLSKLFDPFVSRLIRSQGQKQMAALKEVLEAQV